MNNQPSFCMFPFPKAGEQQWIDNGTIRQVYEWNGTAWVLIRTEPTSGWMNPGGTKRHTVSGSDAAEDDDL